MDLQTLRLFQRQLDVAKGQMLALDSAAKDTESAGRPADAAWVARLAARVHQCEALLAPIAAFVEYLIDEELSRNVTHKP